MGKAAQRRAVERHAFPLGLDHARLPDQSRALPRIAEVSPRRQQIREPLRRLRERSCRREQPEQH